MAEHTSTRAGSRRTTPKPAPQLPRVGTQSSPKRITRSMRSQSRDVSISDDGETGPKGQRGAKQTTSDGTHGTTGQSISKARNGRPAKNARTQQDLSVVVEDPTVVYPELETAEDSDARENGGDVRAGQRHIEQNYKSPAGLSAMSGTTARISLPTQDPSELGSEEILDTLPDLSDASEKLLSFVIPAELSQASIVRTTVPSKDSRGYRKFKRLGDIFERQRKEYGGDSYINVEETLMRLLGSKAGPINEQTATWRPDALLQKANLATLVLRMLIAGKDLNSRFLEDLAGTFPRPFVQSFGRPESLTPECTALTEATFQLALEVRTQEAIMLLGRHFGKINFDPDAALLQVFYHAKSLKGWTVSGLRTADLKREAQSAILGRIEQLREAFKLNVPRSSDGQFSVIESLRVKFPWTDFAQQMITWAGQRLNEIKIQTMTYGGAQAICQELFSVTQSGRLRQSSGSDNVDDESDSTEPESEMRLEHTTSSESRGTSENQDALARPTRSKEFELQQFKSGSSKSESAAAFLKQRQSGNVVNDTEQMSAPQNQDLASDVQVTSTAGPSLQASTPQKASHEQVGLSPAAGIPPSGQVASEDQDENWRPEGNEEEVEDIERTRKLNAERQLAFRRITEAENNKENIAEIQESQFIKNREQRPIHDRAPLGTRDSPIEESEISSDEGFQPQQAPNVAEQRRIKPATKRPASGSVRHQPRSPKKVRVQENVNARVGDSSADNAGEDQENDLPPSQFCEEYMRANNSAKERTALVTKTPQKRSAWTVAETDMLIYLITEHGTSWKLLKVEDKQQGHVLEARDQVALKDKARNMKMDYLKAGKVLPGNFERIPLSQLQIKRLRDCGVEYDSETGTRIDAEVIT